MKKTDSNAVKSLYAYRLYVAHYYSKHPIRALYYYMKYKYYERKDF